MDGLFFILLIILAFGLIIGIPITVSILINRLLKKKVNVRIAKIIASIPVLILIFIFFRACNPSDDFYKEDFAEITTIDFPNSGKIKHKKASFPDHHGDYSSCSLIELSNSDYKMLVDTIVELGFVEQENKFSSKEHKTILGKLKDLKVEHEFVSEKGGAYYVIQFLSDKKSIIALRISW